MLENAANVLQGNLFLHFIGEHGCTTRSSNLKQKINKSFLVNSDDSQMKRGIFACFSALHKLASVPR